MTNTKTISIEIPEEDWQELVESWDDWHDESCALHAAYYFRRALIESGYLPKKNE